MPEIVTSERSFALTKQLFGFMNNSNVLVIFKGEFSENMIITFCDKTFENLNILEISRKIKKRVFHIMVEMLQNVARHSLDYRMDHNERMGSGMVVIGYDAESVYINTLNIGSSRDGEKITAMVDRINAHDIPQLKQMYEDELTQGEWSHKGGAGLGIIDMKMKSGNNVGIETTPIENDLVMVSLLVKVNYV